MSSNPLIATHEVANCQPTVVKIPSSTIWEPCLILQANADSFDVQIICDTEIVQTVPKRFVRPIRIAKSKLWSEAKVKLLQRVVQQVRLSILKGSVMPIRYMRLTVDLFKMYYPSMTNKQIANKWNLMVAQGRDRAVVSKNPRPLRKTAVSAVTTEILTKGKRWSQAEQTILTQILTGDDGLLKMPTIPRNVFECASEMCKMQGVNRSAGACKSQWRDVISPEARQRSRGVDIDEFSIAHVNLVRRAVDKSRRDGTSVPIKALAARLQHSRDDLKRVLQTSDSPLVPSQLPIPPVPPAQPTPPPSPSPPPSLPTPPPSPSPPPSLPTPPPSPSPTNITPPTPSPSSPVDNTPVAPATPPPSKPEGYPAELWNVLTPELRVMCVETLAKRDEEKVREGFEQGKVHAQKVLEEENNLLKELLKKYRKAFRGRCPQQLEDLTDTDVRKFTPFPSKKHLLIWFNHFVAGPTLYNGKTVPRYTTIEGYAGYQERYRTARRTQEDIDHPDMFGDGDLDGIPLAGARQKLEKMRHKLRKKKAVKQYHSAAVFKEPPLVSAEQRVKFKRNKRSPHGQLGSDFSIPTTKRKRVARPYVGTACLNVQQECLILLMAYKVAWPIECLADKFLGAYDEASTRVIRNVLVTWTAFLHTVMKSEDWWVTPDVCDRVKPKSASKAQVEWDYIADCTAARCQGIPRSRDANSWLYSTYYNSTGGKFCVIIVPNGGIVGISTTFGAGTGDRKIMRHMGVFDSEAYRRLDCTCSRTFEGDNVCTACQTLAIFAYDAAITDAVIGEFRDAKVDILVSGVRKEHRDDKLECAARSLAQYISSQRIKVECVIGIVKKEFRILDSKCGLIPSWWVPQIDKICFLCCVLHNFRYRVLNK